MIISPVYEKSTSRVRARLSKSWIVTDDCDFSTKSSAKRLVSISDVAKGLLMPSSCDKAELYSIGPWLWLASAKASG